jgi:hypothetical protein
MKTLEQSMNTRKKMNEHHTKVEAKHKNIGEYD